MCGHSSSSPDGAAGPREARRRAAGAGEHRPKTAALANLRPAVAGAGLGAALVGLLGVDGGLVWVVAGIWAVRAMAGTPLGGAWGVACIGAGLRWGTVSIADVEVASRLAGATLFAGSPIVRGGLAAAAVAALIGEAQIDGLRARAWGERAAAIGAVVVLIPLFAARGPGDPMSVVPLSWALLAALTTAVLVVIAPVAARLPAWVPAIVAAGGIAASTVL